MFVAALVTGACSMAHGQTFDELRTRYGGNIGLDINLPIANFAVLPTVPSCCPGFTGGVGVGLSISALIENPLSRHWIWGLRGGYENRSATLSATQSIDVIANGSPTKGAFTHTLNSSLSYVGVTPFLGWHPFRKLTVMFGLIGAMVVGATYDQREEITQPTDRGTFDDGRRIRNASAGSIPEINAFDFGPMLGFCVDIPTSGDHTMFISPEITYAASFTSIVKDISWFNSVLRIGLSVKWMPEEPPPQPKAPLVPGLGGQR